MAELALSAIGLTLLLAAYLRLRAAEVSGWMRVRHFQVLPRALVRRYLAHLCSSREMGRAEVLLKRVEDQNHGVVRGAHVWWIVRTLRCSGAATFIPAFAPPPWRRYRMFEDDGLAAIHFLVDAFADGACLSPAIERIRLSATRGSRLARDVEPHLLSLVEAASTPVGRLAAMELLLCAACGPTTGRRLLAHGLINREGRGAGRAHALLSAAQGRGTLTASRELAAFEAYLPSRRSDAFSSGIAAIAATAPWWRRAAARFGIPLDAWAYDTLVNTARSLGLIGLATDHACDDEVQRVEWPDRLWA